MEKLYTYNIFLSSPSDLEHEKALICQHIERVVNQTVGQWACIRLNPISEKDSRPGASTSAQDVIDSTIPEYDIYLGVVWRKIGTPTNGSDSGTLYEYDRAMALKSEGKVHEVMVYIKEDVADTKEQSIRDLEELIKVKQFKERLKNENVLYCQFSSDLELTNLLTIHLVNLCSSLASRLVLPKFSEEERSKKLNELGNEVKDALQEWAKLNTGYEDSGTKMKNELFLAIRSEWGTDDKTVVDPNRFVQILLNGIKNYLMEYIKLEQKHSESLARFVHCYTEFIAVARSRPSKTTPENIEKLLKSLQPIKKAYADNSEEGKMQLLYPVMSFVATTIVPESAMPNSEIGEKLKEFQTISDLTFNFHKSLSHTCVSVLATLEAVLIDWRESMQNSIVLRLKPTLGAREVLKIEA